MTRDNQTMNKRRLLEAIIGSLIVVAVALVSAEIKAEVELPEGDIKTAADWEDYEKKLSVRCLGPFVTISKPREINISGRTFVIYGYKLVEKGGRANQAIRIGVVSTSKDTTEETKHNLRGFTDWFKSENVSAIVMGGDISDKASGVKEMLEILAMSGLPVYAVMGNNDIRGEFNSGVKSLREKYPNVFNMNLVRMVDAVGYDIISLPGYYDPQYTASRNTCVYTDSDISAMARLVKESNDPIILLSHGPPKDKGKEGIDFATAGANVGDERITKFISEQKIPFGVFGHIIEAGGKATLLEGKKPIAEGAWSERFYLNPGSSSAVYWGLNDGRTSVGMAAILEIQGKKGRYFIKNIDAAEHKKYLEKSDAKELEELKGLEP
ncbi:MAG: hypothetical protein Kow0090_20940 [Myxococcota bacterium]